LPDGIELFYTDSGAPNAAHCTTLVVLHGSAGLVRLHGHANANAHALRTIICHRRDYCGSTKDTNAELADLNAGCKAFQDRLALQMAWFLQHFIKTENMPRAQSG
ncbi:hypothetical protein B0H14DRAFT_2286064, partial [Mycena olivaceomarginata]